MRARLTLLVPHAGFAAVAVACFAVPVVFSRRAAEVYMVPKMTIAVLCLVVALLGLGAWALAARANPFPATRVALPLGVLVTLTALATIASTSPVVSLIGQYGRYDGLAGLLTCAGLAACLVAYTWRDPERLRWIVYAIVAGAVIDLAYVTVQHFGWDWVDWTREGGLPLPWPYGLLGNSDFSGAHLAISMPLALGLALRARSTAARVALGALVPASGLGIWWMANRGGVLAALGGLAVATVLVPSAFPRFVRWTAGALAILAVGVVVIAATTNSVPGSEAIGPTHFLSTNTLQSRIDIWAAATDMVAEHPLLGIGPDTFPLHYPEHRRAVAPDVQALNADEAHDIYLDRAATAGVPALLAYLWLLGTVGAATWRRRASIPDEQRWLLVGLGGATAAYLLQGTVSIDVLPLALLGWVCLGGLVTLGDPRVIARRDGEAGDLGHELRPLSTLSLVAGAVLLVAATAVAVRPLVADVHYRDGVRSTSDGQPLAAGAKDFAAAIAWLPTEPRYHSRRADQLALIARTETSDPKVRSRLLREAIDGYDQALARAPGDVAILRSRARAEVALSGTDGPAHLRRAEDAYRRILSRVATDADVHSELAGVLSLQSGRAEGTRARALLREAIDQAETGVRIYDRSPRTRAQLAGLYLQAGRLEAARAQLRAAVRLAPNDADLKQVLDRVERRIAARR